ncbi:MAG: hypothetical protein JRJ79_14625 [Deltaproteobacteria bacterium]|nr:hypothetical protein [Deltaproteobacteria bacterium]
MPCDYDRIREDNIREYGKGTRHLSFLGRLYTDRTHFIFELLQNAEDAGATKILFELFEDRLEVKHDGRLFDERDVRGVCGVGEETKAEDLTLIGKFGIGFKSVYAYTSAPEVHSGVEHFRIEHYVRPYKAATKTPGDSWTTLFIFAFNAPDLKPQTAVHEIAERLRNLSARTLLFLRKIKEIEYRLPDETGGVYLREVVTRCQAREVTVIGQNNGKDVDESWLVFERPIPDDTYSVKVEIGFKIEKSAEDQAESIIKIKESPLVVFFPTERSTRFGFLIQGPYRTTPSRDNVPKDDDWNTKLVEETALLLVDALLRLKEMGLLTVALLDALPIRKDDFPEDSMFYPIVEAVYDALLDQELLPADDGTFVSARSAKLARGAELRKLLTHNQLRVLFKSNDDIRWLSGEITQDRTPDLRTYLMSGLDVEEITPEVFSRKISYSFLVSQADDWFVAFYKYLSDQEALWRSPRWSGDPAGLLRSKAILRLENNRHVVPFLSDGTPNAFLPPPEDTDFPVVKRRIVSNEQAADFLRRLGLSEPDVFDDIVKRVLPKYTRQDVSFITPDEHAMDIQKIMRAMKSDSEAGKKKVLQAAINTPFLRAVDRAGTVAFQKPGNIYVKDEDLQLYFSQATDIWFLDETSADPPSDAEAWADLGVAFLPRRMTFTGGLPPEVRERSTREEKIENYDLDGLDEFLEHLKDTLDLDGRRKLSLVLWNYLREHLESNPRFFKGRYEWFYHRPHTKYFDSRMLLRLRESAWIATQYGNLEKPSNITRGHLGEEFVGADELMDILGIHQDADQDFSGEELQRHQHAERLGVSLEDIELVKQHREEFEQWKSDLAKREKPAFPTRISTNPDRRQERLAEQMNDAPEKEYEQRNRSVRTTKGAIDPNLWLRNQYTNDAGQMICQICKEEMPFRKRDGEYYFERVEALARDYFPKELEAQFLALCPLCAAMYNEFVIKDKGAMESLKNTLINSEDAEVPLQLGELDTSVRFVESHFLDIRTIIEALE